MQNANIAGLMGAASSYHYQTPDYRDSKSNNNAMPDPTVETPGNEYCLNSVNQMVKLMNVCLPPAPPQSAHLYHHETHHNSHIVSNFYAFV